MDTTQTPFTYGITIGGTIYYAVHNGIIQSNKIGTDTSGMIFFLCMAGINFYSSIYDTVSTIQIGGAGAGEGNLIAVQGIDARAGYNYI